MRWLVQQKIKEYHLLKKYDWFILSRADEFHICDHIPLADMDSKFAWVPEGEHYGGWQDR